MGSAAEGSKGEGDDMNGDAVMTDAGGDKKKKVTERSATNKLKMKAAKEEEPADEKGPDGVGWLLDFNGQTNCGYRITSAQVAMMKRKTAEDIQTKGGKSARGKCGDASREFD
jgi:hypothetical protein